MTIINNTNSFKMLSTHACHLENKFCIPNIQNSPSVVQNMLRILKYYGIPKTII